MAGLAKGAALAVKAGAAPPRLRLAAGAEGTLLPGTAAAACAACAVFVAFRLLHKDSVRSWVSFAWNMSLVAALLHFPERLAVRR